VSIRFTIQDHKELTTFKDILGSVEGLLPLDFIIGVYTHMKSNPQGFDTTWLQRALITAKEIAEAQNLNVNSQGILLASIMLMESGRRFIGTDPHEGSVAFAISFINMVAPRYFSEDEIKTICNCLRYNRQRFRRSVDGAFVLMVSEVSILTNVRFKDIDNAVVSYVKDNKCGDVDSSGECQIETWHDSLAIGFDMMYGHEGTVWNNLTRATQEAFKDHILSFKRLAANKVVIKSIIGHNYQRIFSR